MDKDQAGMLLSYYCADVSCSSSYVASAFQLVSTCYSEKLHFFDILVVHIAS